MPSKSQAQVLQSLLSTPIDKLYGLQDIETSRSWDCSLPTIGSKRSFVDRLNFKSDESFFGIFEKDVDNGLPYQILKEAGVFDDSNDLVLFGGCILDIILKRHGDIMDFDMRLVGESYMDNEEKCIAKAKKFVASVFSTLSKKNKEIEEQSVIAKNEGRHFYARKCDLQEVVVSRSRSTVTVHVPDFSDYSECIFQLTFTPVKSVKDMLSNCQPHCTRLAIKDGAVVLDHTARYCIESTCIVVDTASFVNYYCGDANDDDEEAKRVTSGLTMAGQMSRYIKYFENKGFDIILPELDMTKVPRRNLEYDVVEVLALPSMIVKYDDVDKNHIMTTSLELPKDLKKNVPLAGLIGSYDSSPAPNVGESIHHNIRCLVNEVYDSFKYVAKGERWDHVFNFVPLLTTRMVRKSYETVREDLEDGVIPVHRLTGYFSVTPPHEVVEQLIAWPLKSEICQKGRLPKPYVLDDDVLKALSEKEISSLIEKIDGLEDEMKGKGLHKLVVPFPENLSTVEELASAIYGSKRLKGKVDH